MAPNSRPRFWPSSTKSLSIYSVPLQTKVGHVEKCGVPWARDSVLTRYLQAYCEHSKTVASTQYTEVARDSTFMN
jgi:hypothetical protein